MSKRKREQTLLRRSVAVLLAAAVIAGCSDSDDSSTEASSAVAVSTEVASTEVTSTEVASTEVASTEVTGTEVASTGPAPVKGGVLSVGYFLDSGCIDPHQNFGTQVMGVVHTFVDSLVYQQPDSGKIVPWLAESWEVSDDLQTFTFTLRDDVTFSDGSKLTAEVVKANFDAMIALGAAAIRPSAYLVGYQESTVVDERTVTVSFDIAQAGFLQALSTPPMGIVSLETTKLDGGTRCRGEVIGTGPFVLDDYTPDVGAEVSRRDGYAWAPEGIENQGEAHLDGIKFEIIADASVRIGRLLDGDLDVGLEMPAPDIERMRDAGLQVYTSNQPGLAIVASASPNAIKDPNDPVSDLALRQAMQLAINRDDIVGTFGVEEYKAATSVLSPTTPYYVDKSDQLEQNVEEARRILDEGGWTMSDNGIRTKNGMEASVTLLFFAPPTSMPPWLVMQQQLKDVGIDFQIEEVPFTDGQARMAAGDFQFVNTGFGRADPLAMLGLRNRDADLDGYLGEISSTLDEEARQEAVNNAVDRVLSQALAIPLYPLLFTNATSAEVEGFTLDATNFAEFSGVWLNE